MFDCCICSSSGSSSTTTHPHTLSITKTIHTSIHGSDSTRVCTQVKCNNMSTEWRRYHHQQQQNHLYSHRAPLETQRTSDCKINPHNDTTRPHIFPRLRLRHTIMFNMMMRITTATAAEAPAFLLGVVVVVVVVAGDIWNLLIWDAP